MWSCPGNMPKYYPGLRDILPDPKGNMLAYYLDKTTLLYNYLGILFPNLLNQIYPTIFKE